MLVAKGIDAQYAADVVRKTIRRSAFAEAATMLDEGTADEQVRDHLIKGGLDAEAAGEIVGAAALSRTFRRWPILSVLAGLASSSVASPWGSSGSCSATATAAASSSHSPTPAPWRWSPAAASRGSAA